MHSDDDSVFNDDLSDSEISNLIHNVPLSLSLYLSLNNKLQRNLYGEIIPQLYVEMETFSSKKTFPPTHHFIDYESCSTYIYPTNFEIRDYQFNIVQRAFYDNLLVALPTGLGKTFIASTVMLNFTRWFPQAKIIFMAPTKPLVAQQIKACCGITGITTSKVAILLDKSRRNRAEIWNSKTVFFTTPQVVENDLTTGIVDPKLVVLLVIDEAHKSKGNYAYNNVVKFLTRFNSSFRILALTATPASDVEGVQEIIDNLSISKVEVRTEQSIDITKYMKQKTLERVTVSPSIEISDIVDLLCTAIKPILSMANERRIYDMSDPLKINAFQVIDASQRLLKNTTIPDGLKWQNYFILQVLNVVGQALRRLNIYGIKSFYNYFYQKHKEFTTKFNNKKSNNKTTAKFYFHENISIILSKCKELSADENFLGHPKLEILINELKEFFEANHASNSRAIIFTEYRESALDIVSSIEKMGGNLRPHIFIGQSKEKEKFDEEKYLTKNKKNKPKGKSTKLKLNDDDVVGAQRSGTRTSSEDAQIKGMNQKLQKELIKKFKQGEYNILVATSIGEEGLDIGEVDLIVCYDSTSSPIKNIQRMGRTGRKRDGKVLLLFAGNEELKFDKAMAGYEFIQQHIMKNKLITLAQSNRIIPKDYKPIVEKKFIEIPDENFEIKAEEDEDEIIRIATMYMNSKVPKASKSKTRSKPKNPEKKFFIPDNVTIGFQNVAAMVRRVDKDNSIAESRREKDFLDKILDSDTDDEIPSQSKGLPVENKSKASSNYNAKSKEIEQSETMNENGLIEDTVKKINGITQLHSPSHEESETSNSSGMSKFQTLLNLDKANGAFSLEKEVDHSTDAVDSRKKMEMTKFPDSYEDNCTADPKRKTLGLKRRKTNITDQLKKQYNKAIKPSAANEIFSVDENEYYEPKIKEKRNENTNLKDDFGDTDVFDDGLDDEILLIANDKLSSFERSTSPTVKASTESHDEVYKHEFSKNEGLLNHEETFELYTSYFSILDPIDRIHYYDPININRFSNTLDNRGKVGHSKISKRLIQFSQLNQSLSPVTALKIIKDLKLTSIDKLHDSKQYIQEITKLDSL